MRMLLGGNSAMIFKYIIGNNNVITSLLRRCDPEMLNDNAILDVFSSKF